MNEVEQKSNICLQNAVEWKYKPSENVNTQVKSKWALSQHLTWGEVFK